MESLISFDGASDVINNLIDKLASAASWVVMNETPSRTAVDTYIKEIQESDLAPLTKAALISNAKKTIKEYCNQKDIVSIAVQSLLPSAQPQNVDPDWLAQFMDKGRLVSDEQFQILWGNILAEECNQPGSVPKSLLHIMEQMDKDMAMSFMKVAAVSVCFEENEVAEYSPIVRGDSTSSLRESVGVSYDELVNLQSIGLIETNFGVLDTGFFATAKTEPVKIRYFDEEFQLPAGRKSFGVGKVIYTKAGQALCHAVRPQKIDGFFEKRCVPYWEKEIKDNTSYNC